MLKDRAGSGKSLVEEALLLLTNQHHEVARLGSNSLLTLPPPLPLCQIMRFSYAPPPPMKPHPPSRCLRMAGLSYGTSFMYYPWEHQIAELYICSRLSPVTGINELPCRFVSLRVPGAHNPKGRSVELVIPPVVEWHLQENSIYGMLSSYAWLVYH